MAMMSPDATVKIGDLPEARLLSYNIDARKEPLNIITRDGFNTFEPGNLLAETHISFYVIFDDNSTRLPLGGPVDFEVRVNHIVQQFSGYITEYILRWQTEDILVQNFRAVANDFITTFEVNMIDKMQLCEECRIELTLSNGIYQLALHATKGFLYSEYFNDEAKAKAEYDILLEWAFEHMGDLRCLSVESKYDDSTWSLLLASLKASNLNFSV